MPRGPSEVRRRKPRKAAPGLAHCNGTGGTNALAWGELLTRATRTAPGADVQPRRVAVGAADASTPRNAPPCGVHALELLAVSEAARNPTQGRAWLGTVQRGRGRGLGWRVGFRAGPPCSRFGQAAGLAAHDASASKPGDDAFAPETGCSRKLNREKAGSDRTCGASPGCRHFRTRASESARNRANTRLGRSNRPHPYPREGLRDSPWRVTFRGKVENRTFVPEVRSAHAPAAIASSGAGSSAARIRFKRRLAFARTWTSTVM